VLVGPQQKVHHPKSGRGGRDYSCGLSETEPAVDLPLQFNFGSPYSSSLVVFFDFEHNKIELEGKGVKICDRKT